MFRFVPAIKTEGEMFRLRAGKMNFGRLILMKMPRR